MAEGIIQDKYIGCDEFEYYPNAIIGILYNNTNYLVSDYIKVAADDVILISQRIEQTCVFYDEDKNIISGIANYSLGSNQELNNIIRVPNNTSIKYARFNVKKSLDNYDCFAIYQYKYNTASLASKLSGKRMLFIGDSITESNFRSTKNYHEYIAEWTGITALNYGVSGTGYLDNATFGAGWLTKLNNDVYPASENVDAIIVFGALNDRYHTVDAFMTQVTEFYENLIEKYPDTPILVVSSTPREYSYGADGSENSDELNYRINRNDLIVALEEIVRSYNLPYCDMYNNSGMEPWNTAYNKHFFSCSAAPNGDGVHPNAIGHEIIAAKMMELFDAKFNEVSYNINYILDGGTNNADNHSSYTIETNTFELKPAVKAGYSFIGWFSDNTPVTVINKGSYGNYELEARYTLNEYTVTYILDNSINPNTVLSYNIHTPNIQLLKAEKAGYKFIGWLDSSTNEYITQIDSSRLEDITLTAVFKEDVKKPDTWRNLLFFAIGLMAVSAIVTTYLIVASKKKKKNS